MTDLTTEIKELISKYSVYCCEPFRRGLATALLSSGCYEADVNCGLGLSELTEMQRKRSCNLKGKMADCVPVMAL